MEKTTIARLEPALRDELEALLGKQPTPAFLSDFQDMLVPKLFALLLGLVGLVGGAYDVFTEGLPLGEQLALAAEYPLGLVQSPGKLGLLVGPVLVAWAAMLIAQNVGRCGYAALSTTLMVVRGKKVKVFRYAEVAKVESRKLRTKKQAWTALDLTLKDGSRHTLHVQGGWVAEVSRRMGRA